jgi:hypothetical protein
VFCFWTAFLLPAPIEGICGLFEDRFFLFEGNRGLFEDRFFLFEGNSVL